MIWAANLNLADQATTGDTVAVRTMIQQGADVNAVAADGTTALHWIVRADDLELAALLIQAGAHVNVADRYGVTPLALACANGNAAMVRKLLEAGANANAADGAGETVLMTAAKIGNTDVLELLLDHGAKVNAREPLWQSTALMLAVRANQPAAVQLLLDRGAEVDARTRIGEKPARRPPNAGGGSHGLGINRGGVPESGSQPPTPGGMTAVLYAVRDGRFPIARMLLTKGADVNLADANGIPPLQMAISNGQTELAEFLLDHGAKVNAADDYGRTALWLAVEFRDLEYDRAGVQGVNRASVLELIERLIAHGADVNARTTDVPPTRRFIMPLGDLSWVSFIGQTPFLRAAQSADLTVMHLLLDHGADPNIATVEGTTALMAAAGVNWMTGQTYTESKEAQLEAVKLCFEKGGSVNAVNSMGLTSMHGAANRGSDEIIEFLARHGAQLDAKDKQGRTPMDFAEGVFLETNPPERKPGTVALLQKLMGQTPVAQIVH